MKTPDAVPPEDTRDASAGRTEAVIDPDTVKGPGVEQLPALWIPLAFRVPENTVWACSFGEKGAGPKHSSTAMPYPIKARLCPFARTNGCIRAHPVFTCHVSVRVASRQCQEDGHGAHAMRPYSPRRKPRKAQGLRPGQIDPLRL